MMKEVLVHIARIDVIPIVSLILFMAFFTVILVRAMRMRGQHTRYMGNLPLDGTQDSTGDVQ